VRATEGAASNAGPTSNASALRWMVRIESVDVGWGPLVIRR